MTFGRELAVDRVIAEQVGVGLDRTQIVDGDDLNILATAFNDATQDETSDASETVDRYPNRHVISS